MTDLAPRAPLGNCPEGQERARCCGQFYLNAAHVRARSRQDPTAGRNPAHGRAPASHKHRGWRCVERRIPSARLRPAYGRSHTSPGTPVVVLQAPLLGVGFRRRGPSIEWALRNSAYGGSGRRTISATPCPRGQLPGTSNKGFRQTGHFHPAVFSLHRLPNRIQCRIKMFTTAHFGRYSRLRKLRREWCDVGSSV